MYLTSLNYKDKIESMDRIFKLEIRIEHSNGTLVLDDNHIEQGSLIHTDASQSGDEFTIGGTVASDISFTLVNKKDYEDINFMGAKVVPTVGVLIREAVDAHFIQPSQPSKMPMFEDKYEFIPLGQFNIDVVDRKRSTINLKAIDNMIHLNKSYSLSKLKYPATLYHIFTDICNVVDVNFSTSSFPNKDYLVKSRPEGDVTLRNILGYVAELSGGFAKFNRLGTLELKWYEETGVEITPDQRSNLDVSDFEINITGVSITVPETKTIVSEVEGEIVTEEVTEDVTYLTGTDDYAIDLSGNVLLKDSYDSVLPNILANIGNTIFTPYNAQWNGNPAMDAGDIITHIDIDDNVINSLITNITYKYRGTSDLSGKGLPNISRGFESTDNRLVQIIQRVEEDVGNKLNSLEQQQLQAMELIINTLGGYATKRENAFYIHDALKLENSTKVWKWGLGGFGYFPNGLDNPPITGVTAEGSIFANLITANMVQTGTLSSLNGVSNFDLDNGYFNLGSELSYDGTTLMMGGNTSISWGNITDKNHIPSRSEIPTSPSDIGAKPDWWLPSWGDVSNKPTIPNDEYITNITKNTITTSYINALNITAKYIEADALYGKTINAVNLSGGTINIGNGSFRVNSSGSLYGANGNFSVPYNGDGVINDFGGASRWKYNNSNYIYQDSDTVAFYIGGDLHMRYRKVENLHWSMRIGSTSSGATLKALNSGDQLQVRNGADSAYIAISASEFKLASSETIKTNITPCESTLDLVKDTQVYNFQLIEDSDDSKMGLMSKSSPPDIKTGFIAEEAPDEIRADLGDIEGISLSNTVAVLWKAVQELTDKVEILEQKQSI